jgi:hypothetical protein
MMMSSIVGILSHEFVGDEKFCAGILGYGKASPYYGMVCRQPRDAEIHTGGLLNENKNRSSAFDRQVGGSHYKNMAIQPIEFIVKNKIPFLEGNVIKYVVRWSIKNGLEDLKKARHYLDLLIEMEENKVNET